MRGEKTKRSNVTVPEHNNEDEPLGIRDKWLVAQITNNNLIPNNGYTFGKLNIKNRN